MEEALKIELLNIDDDELVLFIHETLIEQTEFSAGSKYFLKAKEALEFLDNHSTFSVRYLILLDINMPEMNGWDFLDILMDKWYASYITVLLVSSSENESDKLRAKKYNVVKHFLSKPLKIEHFDIIRQVLTAENSIK